jgi:hypothetical protein
VSRCEKIPRRPFAAPGEGGRARGREGQRMIAHPREGAELLSLQRKHTPLLNREDAYLYSLNGEVSRVNKSHNKLPPRMKGRRFSLLWTLAARRALPKKRTPYDRRGTFLLRHFALINDFDDSPVERCRTLLNVLCFAPLICQNRTSLRFRCFELGLRR